MSFGGLIADVMGLGKTLTMLAAVLRSMPAAEDSSKFYEASGNEYSNKFRTKATLVVVSSARKLRSPHIWSCSNCPQSFWKVGYPRYGRRR